ncbi:zinc finger odd-paired-like (opl) [Fusarium pseudoanthophilum]|uniref:Zinc finger odd-paired-like (Opl) n=1 Tax=Fusarium pseudoanthophilum TaxID=48495 RepID=A0A8H5NVF3_9HYPO|nr:zinc finger odd-paired-like (opl) [Fusarium pseudoanthophilum]
MCLARQHSLTFIMDSFNVDQQLLPASGQPLSLGFPGLGLPAWTDVSQGQGGSVSPRSHSPSDVLHEVPQQSLPACDAVVAPYFNGYSVGQCDMDMGFNFSPTVDGHVVDQRSAFQHGPGNEVDFRYIANSMLFGQPHQLYGLFTPPVVSEVPTYPPWGYVDYMPTQDGSPELLRRESHSSSDTSDFRSHNLQEAAASENKQHPASEASTQPSALNEDLPLDYFHRYPCPYPGCRMRFKRKEHAKRHHISKHLGKGIRLTCEFCGKNTFNRADNLNAHRKLHARRRPAISSGVHYIPHAETILNAQKEKLDGEIEFVSCNTKSGIRKI